MHPNPTGDKLISAICLLLMPLYYTLTSPSGKFKYKAKLQLPRPLFPEERGEYAAS